MSRRAQEIVHVGPSSEGGMRTMIRLFLGELGQGRENRFIPSYGYFRTNYWGNLLFFAKAILSICVRVPSRSRIYQLHTSERGSFYRKWLISLIIRIRREEYVVHMHGARFDAFLDAAGPRIQRLFRSFVDHSLGFVVLSDSWHRYFTQACPGLSRIQVIPNPTERILPEPASRPRGATVRFLYSGIYGRRKGSYDLIDAFAQASLDAELWMFGDGEIEQVRAHAARQPNSGRIQVLPWLSHCEYLLRIPEFDVFVLPSYAEGLPMSILEAIGQGLPVISTRVGGIPEAVLHGTNGLLIEPGDIPALAAALVTLASQPDVRSAMAVESIQVARCNFSIESARLKWAKVYDGNP